MTTLRLENSSKVTWLASGEAGTVGRWCLAFPHCACCLSPFICIHYVRGNFILESKRTWQSASETFFSALYNERSDLKDLPQLWYSALQRSAPPSWALSWPSLPTLWHSLLTQMQLCNLMYFPPCPFHWIPSKDCSNPNWGTLPGTCPPRLLAISCSFTPLGGWGWPGAYSFPLWGLACLFSRSHEFCQMNFHKVNSPGYLVLRSRYTIFPEEPLGPF